MIVFYASRYPLWVLAEFGWRLLSSYRYIEQMLARHRSLEFVARNLSI